MATLRVKRETKRRVLRMLADANRKEFGRRLRPDDLIAKVLDFVQPEHLAQLQESTLSNAERLERLYREHVNRHGAVSKDVFIGLMLPKCEPDRTAVDV